MRNAAKVVLGGTWLTCGAALAYAGLVTAEMPSVLSGLTLVFTGLVVMLDGLL